MSSSAFQLSPTHPLAHASTLLISAVGTSLGIYALRSPAAFADGWGLPSERHSPLWTVFAGRNIALGLLLSTFSVQGKLREVGTCLLCSVVTAGVDGVVTVRYGDERKMWGHFIPAAVMGGFGAWLVFFME